MVHEGLLWNCYNLKSSCCGSIVVWTDCQSVSALSQQLNYCLLIVSATLNAKAEPFLWRTSIMICQSTGPADRGEWLFDGDDSDQTHFSRGDL